MKKNGEFVGVDEKFIPEDEKYVDESLLGNKEETKEKVEKVAKTAGKVAKGVGIGYLVFIIICILIGIGMFAFAGSFILKTRKNVYKQWDNFGSLSSSVGSQIKNQMSKQEIDSFNRAFETNSGTKTKTSVGWILDDIVTNNKKNNDKIITVIYNETTTTDPNKIVELKQAFEQGKEYEVILDYDTNGLVNKVTIKDIK